MFPSNNLRNKAIRNNIDRINDAKARPALPRLKAGVERLVAQRPSVKIEWSKRTGAPAFMHGSIAPRISGSPSDIARNCLADLSEVLGIAPDLANIVEMETFEWAGHRHVRFQQVQEGIPVYGAELLVVIAPDNEVRMITGDIEPDLALKPLKKTISKRDAIDIAQADLGNGSVRLRGRVFSETVLYPTLKGYARCYHLILPTAQPLGDWRYFVNVETGDIEDSCNAMFFIFPGARGYVYLQNPEESHRTTGLLRNLQPPYTRLSGLHVKIENDIGPEAVAEDGYRFYYADGDPHFDEVNCYHAVDIVYRNFKDLGFRGFVVNNPFGRAAAPRGQIRATVHVGTAFDNAYYSSVTGGIYFGDGSFPANPNGLRSLAKEVDVIFHEFTHAVLDEIRPGIVGTDGLALHEGYADYFACSFTNPAEPRLGAYIESMPDMLRTLNNSDRYPGAPFEPHARGKVWGGACWELRQQLGNELADYLVFASMILMTSTTPTFKYAKDQLLYADAAYCGGEYRAVIKNIFERQRGIPE